MDPVPPTFYETPEFTRDWERLGLDVDNDLLDLQLAITAAPTAAPVVAGTSGLRKMRYAPPRWSRGKRGGLRVCYAMFADGHVVLLAIVYDKRDRADLKADEKRDVRETLAAFEAALKAGKKK